MVVPPTYFFHELDPQAQMMARSCGNDRIAMILESVAVGSMIVMTGVTASQVVNDASGTVGSDYGWSR